MRIRKNIKIYFYAIGILFLSVLGSCSKNKEENISTGPTGSDRVIYYSMSGIPEDNSVFLKKLSNSNNEIVLAVNVKGGSNVYGVALEINYDSNKISYVSSSKGDYLGNEKDIDFYPVLYQGREGILLIGASKRGIAASGKAGDGTLATITLRALITQTATSIGFNTTNSSLTSALPTGIIAGTNFIGGELSYK
ncbi:MAG: cohesin domain-containing protein [bacterium]|nr:cohesin domain-containing protein [bacterium]